MKKVILSLMLLLGFICLTGCDSNNDAVGGILNELKKEGIVDKNLTLIDKEISIVASFNIKRTTYYIYQNQDSELIAINYNTDISSKNDYDYEVTIYNIDSINDVEYIDDSSSLEYYYIYQDGKKTESAKYEFGNYKSYKVYKKKTLFSKIKYELK